MSYLAEAKWFGNGSKPALDEYLRNGWISVGGPVAMVHAYFLQGRPIRKDSINFLDHGSELIYWSSVATRLNDDLGTSKVCIAPFFVDNTRLKIWLFRTFI